MSRHRALGARAGAAILGSLVLVAGVAPAAVLAGPGPVCEVRDLAAPATVMGDLASAVGGAADGATLQVRGTCAVASAVTIDGPLTIVGKKTAALGAPTLTTTAVGPRILNVHPGAADDVVTLRGLRLTGSTETSDQSGGAIIVLTGTLVLRDVRIDDVEAQSGGAIFVDGGASLVMAGTTAIRNARAAWGGGVYVAAGARLTMRDRASIAYSHAVKGGGAIEGDEGTPGSTIILRDDASKIGRAHV